MPFSAGALLQGAVQVAFSDFWPDLVAFVWMWEENKKTNQFPAVFDITLQIKVPGLIAHFKTQRNPIFCWQIANNAVLWTLHWLSTYIRRNPSQKTQKTDFNTPRSREKIREQCKFKSGLYNSFSTRKTVDSLPTSGVKPPAKMFKADSLTASWFLWKEMTSASSLKRSPRASWVTVFMDRPSRWAHSGVCWASGNDFHFPTSSSTS